MGTYGNCEKKKTLKVKKIIVFWKTRLYLFIEIDTRVSIKNY